MGQGLCGAETGSLAYPQPYIRLYHSQGTSRIQLQGNHGAFGSLLCGKAKDISPDCHEYVKSIFDPKRTAQPEEVYYKLCNSIVSLRRKYDLATFDLTCRQCMKYGIYSYSKFEAILKRNGVNASADETVIFHTPTSSNHGNMRGKDYFTGNDMNQ